MTSYTSLKNPLYIAEKPDMGSKIAKNLPGPHKRGDGYIETGAGVVTWAIGHLLQQAEPDEYDPKYKKWNYADLPILPQQWKVDVSQGKSKQVTVIKNLLKQCSDVVNAGDPGREGQLIVDELLDYLKCQKPAWRLLLNSLDAPTVKKALNNLEPNSKFQPLYEAALGRQRADWIVGMNLTRAYTILGRNKGYQGVLSVGRVQTPTLAIVVRREEEIENFVPQKYWTITCAIGSKPPFTAKYIAPVMYRKKGGDGDEDESKGQENKDQDNKDQNHQQGGAGSVARPAWLDEQLRVCDEQQAKLIVSQIPPQTPAKVVAYQNTPHQEPPPLPFELSDIQSKMNAKYGASVQAVLDACQSLYEKGYASYPRTDCSYLPTTQLPEAPNVLAAIGQARPDLQSILSQVDTSLVSPAWNDAKLGEHHAIIPTGTPANMSELSELERNVYDAIARRYIAQFLPVCEVDKAMVELEASGHRFVARGRVIKVPGWRAVYGTEADGEQDDGQGKGDDKSDKKEDEGDDSGALPALAVGDVHPVTEAKATPKETKPPSRYSEGTLMQAMKHVDRLVSDPAEKKMLKTVQGIGRAATRANIISTLIKRGFLEVKKKQLHPSTTARMLVGVVDKALTDPGLTARWEQALDGVALGKVTLLAFSQRQEQWIKQLIAAASAANIPQAAPGAVGSAQGSSGGGKTYTKPAGGKSGSNPGAKSYAPGAKTPKASSSGGASGGGLGTLKPGGPCPKCGKPMAERTIRQGPKAGGKFLGCTGYPACSHSEWPK